MKFASTIAIAAAALIGDSAHAVEIGNQANVVQMDMHPDYCKELRRVIDERALPEREEIRLLAYCLSYMF